MTDRLEAAFAEAAKLSPSEQDALAALILEEIAADAGWDSAFASSAGPLSSLADEALHEHRAGKTRPLDPDQL
jgi:hypothetical protein